MSNARNARITREINNFATKSPWGITCTPEKEEVYDVLLVNMLGPKGSPYERGSFKLVVNIPKRYPFEPPLVKFLTPVYHPNIDKGIPFSTMVMVVGDLLLGRVFEHNVIFFNKVKTVQDKLSTSRWQIKKHFLKKLAVKVSHNY